MPNRSEQTAARAEIELRKRRRLRLPLGAFIPAISPTYQEPSHLKKVLDVFDRIRAGEPVRVLIDAPPRHAKSETFQHGFTWLMGNDPTRTFVYVSYAQEIAFAKCALSREYATRAKLNLRREAASQWATDEGGWVRAVGVSGGALMGEGISGLAIVDDPYNGRAEAESSAQRAAVEEAVESRVLSRLEPRGSFIASHQRWHPDDLIGSLKRKHPDWEHISLPAIAYGPGGEESALWPERWPLEALHKRRSDVGEHNWASMYQGAPRHRGARVFNDQYRFFTEPPPVYRLAIGVDLATSKNTYADYSVAVLLAEYAGRFYVLHVLRRQMMATQFAGNHSNVDRQGRLCPGEPARGLCKLTERFPGVPMFGYLAGNEIGIRDLMAGPPYFLPFTSAPAVTDKLVRATKVAAAWCRGEFALLQGAPWVDTFTDELLDFTGVNDRHDDQVDALAAAYDIIARGTGKAAVAEPRLIGHGGLY